MRAAHLDPAGQRHGLPTYPVRCAPEDLYTRSQLRQMGLRPTGEPAAQLMWTGARGHRPAGVAGPRTALLYRITETVLRDPVSEMRRAQLVVARACRRICPSCYRSAPYVIPARSGRCLDCDEGQAPADGGAPAGVVTTDVFDNEIGRAAA